MNSVTDRVQLYSLGEVNNICISIPVGPPTRHADRSTWFIHLTLTLAQGTKDKRLFRYVVRILVRIFFGTVRGPEFGTEIRSGTDCKKKN